LFIDIGACIGEYAIWMANKPLPTVAIEPVNYERSLRSRLNNAINGISPYLLGAAGK